MNDDRDLSLHKSSPVIRDYLGIERIHIKLQNSELRSLIFFSPFRLTV